MFEIIIRRNGFEYKYFCEDEQSILFLYRRLKEYYEDNRALSEKVTMTIKDDNYFYTIEDRKLERVTAGITITIAEWGLQ